MRLSPCPPSGSASVPTWQSACARAGNAPLHMAALFQRSDVAKALLLAGADLTLKNGAGELPERMASVSLKLKFNTFKETGDI